LEKIVTKNCIHLYHNNSLSDQIQQQAELDHITESGDHTHFPSDLRAQA